MTTAAIIVMTVSVASILSLFLFCLSKVMSSPMAEDDE